jgi:hypothetical protein
MIEKVRKRREIQKKEKGNMRKNVRKNKERKGT